MTAFGPLGVTRDSDLLVLGNALRDELTGTTRKCHLPGSFIISMVSVAW